MIRFSKSLPSRLRAAVVLVAAGLGFCAHAARRTVPLSGCGWTCDGAAVSVPHSWNGVDGADGEPLPGVEPVCLPPTATARTSASANTYVRKSAVYARALPDPTPGKRCFIRCEGASIKAEVRVNGVAAGRHAGAFTAFAFEVTKLMKPSGNRLEIVVDNRYDPDVPPIMGDFTMFGGLYRHVWLIETDPVCIDPLRDGGPGVDVTTFPDGRVEARTFVNGADSAEVSYEIDGRVYAANSFTVPGAKTWSPETPAVYELKVRLRCGDSEDSVSLPVGFRDARFTAGGFLLNGRRRVIRGVNRHQDREGKGWALSADDEREDVEWIRRVGADGVRCAHYPHSGSFLDLCDRAGLMVWCEVPFVNDMTDSAAFRSNVLAAAREMVAQLRHHPSIVCWGLFNELYSCSTTPHGSMEPLVRAERDLVRSLDPTRATVAASNRLRMPSLNSLPDYVGFNVYHGWYGGRYGGELWYELYPRGLDDLKPLDLLAKLRGANGLDVVCASEYGAGGSPAVHGDFLGRVRHSEEYQAFVHRVNYRAFVRDERTWGTYVWEMFDSGSDSRKESTRHGINNKGLVTYDRKTAKDAFWFYKANWNPEPMLHLVGERMTETTNAAATVCGFSNAGDVELFVNGVSLGAKSPDEVKCVIWRGVPLVRGKNRIELRCGAMSASAVWTRSPSVAVADVGGVPRIVLDGVPVAGTAVMPCPKAAPGASVDALAKFAAAGVRFSSDVWTMNDPRYTLKQWWLGDGKYDWALFDRLARGLVDASADGLIFPRIKIDPPGGWDGFEMDSPEWRIMYRRMMKDMVRHVEASDYADRVLGYHLGALHCGEWLGKPPPDQLPPATADGTSAARRAAVDAFTAKIAEASVQASRALRELVGRRKLIGSFWGYVGVSHEKFQDVLKRGEYDFFAAPPHYRNTREPGRSGMSQVHYADSFRLHGKIFYEESDFRSVLSDPACAPQGQTRMRSVEETVNLIRRSVGKCLCGGYENWWFLLGGNRTFDAPEMMGAIRVGAAEERRTLLSAVWRPAEVAVFTASDEYATSLMSPDGDFRIAFRHAPHRDVLPVCGVPYDSYELADVAHPKLPDYKVYVFLNAFTVGDELREKIRERVARQGRTAVWIRARGVDGAREVHFEAPPDAATYRETFRAAGAHVWCETPEVIAAGRGYLMVHAASDGEKTIRLPGRRDVEEVFGQSPPRRGVGEIVESMKLGETRVYRLAEPKGEE